MANQYLIEIHNYITGKIAGVRQAKSAALQNQGPDRVSYLAGQLEELKDLRGFLKEHFDLPTYKYY